MRSRRWDQMSPVKKVLVMAAVAVKVSLAVSAWSDLAERPAEEVNGTKRTWAMVIGIGYVGPVLYYWKGRRPAAS